MTLEEAREFLINKKVFVKNKGKEVQEKLFNIGFKWVAPEEKEIYKDRYFLFLYEDLTLTYVDVDDIEYFYEHRFKEVSAEDILNIKVEHLPKTWEEFCENNPIKEGEAAMITGGDMTNLIAGRVRLSYNDRYSLPSRSAAEAHRALMQLHQLRNCYRGDVDPALCCYYSIVGSHNPIIVRDASRFLSFPTRELAEEFLINFKDLIEEAGDLI